MKTAPAAITANAAKMVAIVKIIILAKKTPAIAANIAPAVMTANAPKTINAARNAPADTKNKKKKSWNNILAIWKIFRV